MSETQFARDAAATMVIRMPSFVLVGIPIVIICVLGGILAYERHAKRADEHKRADSLKHWLESQGRRE